MPNKTYFKIYPSKAFPISGQACCLCKEKRNVALHDGLSLCGRCEGRIIAFAHDRQVDLDQLRRDVRGGVDPWIALGRNASDITEETVSNS